jgi:hypothetical protein
VLKSGVYGSEHQYGLFASSTIPANTVIFDGAPDLYVYKLPAKSLKSLSDDQREKICPSGSKVTVWPNNACKEEELVEVVGMLLQHHNGLCRKLIKRARLQNPKSIQFDPCPFFVTWCALNETPELAHIISCEELKLLCSHVR